MLSLFSLSGQQARSRPRSLAHVDCELAGVRCGHLGRRSAHAFGSGCGCKSLAPGGDALIPHLEDVVREPQEDPLDTTNTPEPTPGEVASYTRAHNSCDRNPAHNEP